ncbi:MAG: hypothetical protein OXB96_00345 [Candidatus Kaiserbacteria bacterium]|nr:hypothetical protein [Candidatus Kaiserbacteria bacterium]
MVTLSNLSNTSAHIDFSGALAAFGLIFTVYQLRKPSWEIVLHIRSWWQRHLVWIFGGIALLLVLIKAVAPLSSSLVLFLEVGAYISFILSPLSLLYFSTKTKKLFKGRERRFYAEMSSAIATTNDDYARPVVKILLDNLDDICLSAKKYFNHTTGGESKVTEEERTTSLARSVLNVFLSDESVAKILTTKNLAALRHLFVTIQKHNLGDEIETGLSKIFHNLYNDNESFFYKHLDYVGLSISSSIYKTIFGSNDFLNNFNPYPPFYFRDKPPSPLSVRVIVHALSCGIRTHLTKGNAPLKSLNRTAPRNINLGLEHLSEIFNSTCLKMNIKESRNSDVGYSMKDWRDILNTIALFLVHNYSFLARRENVNKNVKRMEGETSEADFYSNMTINAGIAASLCEAIKSLSCVENYNSIHSINVNLFRGLRGHYEKYKKGYEKPFENALWREIKDNVALRGYPATLRTYLGFIGVHLVSKGREGEWMSNQIERVRRLLYIDLKPLIDRCEKMIDKTDIKEALLPTHCMDYRKGKFIYIYRGGSEKEIDPPKDGAKSAFLEGIDDLAH